MIAEAFDAIVVGAGPAGSAAAIRLASAGWSVALVEKQAFPRRKVCGECIAASNLPLLDALGVGAAVAAEAGPELRRVALMRGDRCVVADLPAAPDPRHAWGRALGRERLDTLLADRARDAGATVLQPWTVVETGGIVGAHTATIRDTAGGPLRRLRAPVAILAHGSWQPLPDAREARRRSRRGSDLLAFKANFDGARLEPGLLPVLAFDGGYGGMVIGDGGQFTLACCVRADRLDALRRAAPGVAAGDVVQAMLERDCSGVATALRGATRCGPWLASGPLAPGVRIDADDVWLRIGNAAGEAHPIIGEGISMALQSAWLLADRLLATPRPDAGDAAAAADWQRRVRRDHAADWRRQFAPRLRLAAAFAQVAMRPAASAALMALLSHRPGLLTRGAVWGGKLRNAAEPLVTGAAA